MHTSNPSPSSSSSPPDGAVDTAPFLRHSISDNLLLRSRRFIARFFRRASWRGMMLREPSVRVREHAAAQLEERQSDWAYSKPVVMLDILWNLAFLAVGVIVLGLSSKEKPSVSLRLWIVGYLLQGMFHSLCVVVEFRRRSHLGSSSVLERNGGWESVGNSNFSSGSDEEDYATEQLWENERSSITKHIESANTMFSFIWWLVGFYWVTAGGQNLTNQEGATKEEIDQLPKYKFQMMNEFKKGGDIQDPFGGIMIECDSNTPAEHVIALEDAECCICLSAYDDGAELRELPCNHHFHCTCIDKWLHINATCPLCKFNILRSGNHHQEV